jgi:hypothetical protein
VAQVVPVVAEPAHVVLDGGDVLGVFLRRVGVVQAQVAHAAEFGGDAEVGPDRPRVADVQVAVGLGREAGLDRLLAAGGQVLADDLADEVLPAGAASSATASPGVECWMDTLGGALRGDFGPRV